jgi:CBS domain containing-hemolysin-like protein
MSHRVALPVRSHGSIALLCEDCRSSGALDHQTIQRVVESGYSRVLIQDIVTGEVTAMIHVKDLIFVDPRVRRSEGNDSRCLRH